jgi:YfiH family protein
VHGARVVDVTRPGEHAGERADAAVTAAPGAWLAVRTADCAPVVFTASGVVGIAHAGWRGLVAGVIEATVDAMHALGAGDVRAEIGPCIRAECYDFGAEDLDTIASRYGEAVRSTSAAGGPALDLAAGVRAALTAAGVTNAADSRECTACRADDYYSHRARGDRGRMVTTVVLLP